MGSYHTNNRNISVQLMHRFLDGKDFLPNKWPYFANDFLPILEQCNYQAGSLIQTTVELLNHEDYGCTPIPPVYECIWKSDELKRVEGIANTSLGLPSSAVCTILMLTKRTKQVSLGSFILSSTSSQYRKSDLIFALRESTGVSLAQVLYFSEVNYQSSDSLSASEPIFKMMWVVAVKWFMDHPCKAWYGYPTQVWSFVQQADIDYIPLSSFRARAIYAKATVNFGPLNGCIPVIIATPVEGLCL